MKVAQLFCGTFYENTNNRFWENGNINIMILYKII
jgi:hypothetical protein